MSITIPYYRIYRPMLCGGVPKYLLDDRYANDRRVLCRSYKILEDDLRRIFEFVEPCDDNLGTYSIRIYELVLRAATEFETNCKRILAKNAYPKNNNLNIHDYRKLDSAMKLSDYEVKINIWQENNKIVSPFSAWKSNKILGWYRAYNDVKHDRKQNFSEASLSNMIEAVCAVLVILFAQFDIESYAPYQNVRFYQTDDDDDAKSYGQSIFSVISPHWPNNEKYDFDWDSIRTGSAPFATYQF